ncbi:MAG: hypothetical protein AABY84_13055 [Candidatus Firestonebacteria bacterium]
MDNINSKYKDPKEIVDYIFKERGDKLYIDEKHLDDITVSIDEPPKTLTQVKEENKYILMKTRHDKIRRIIIQYAIVSMAILLFPLTLLIYVFVGTQELMNKVNKR